MKRRDFLKILGIAPAVAAVPALAKPIDNIVVRKGLPPAYFDALSRAKLSGQSFKNEYPEEFKPLNTKIRISGEDGGEFRINRNYKVKQVGNKVVKVPNDDHISQHIKDMENAILKLDLM